MLEGLTQCGWMCCPGWGLGTEVFGCLWRELEWGTREVALEDLLSELEGDPGDVCKIRIFQAHPIHLALYHQDLPLPIKLTVPPLKSPGTSS